jgi:type I restriction enzyme S subunit
LADCGALLAGGTPSRSQAAYWGGTVPWISAKSLRSFAVADSEERLTDAGARVSTLVPPGTLLFVVRGMSLAREFRVGLTIREVAFNQDLRALVPAPDVDGRYLARFLEASSPQILAMVDEASHGTKRLTSDRFESIRVPCPPLPEQRRIAEILDMADALRAKRRATLAKLDTLTQSIFLDMFGDPATNPKGWPQVRLGDAYWFQEGPGVRKWQFKSEGVKLLNVGNIEKDGRLNLDKTNRFLSEEEALGKYRHFLIDAGDLVIASSGISFDEDGLLRTRGAFVSPEHLPLCMNTSTIRFKAKARISDLRFLLIWLSGNEFRNQITKLVTGTAQQNFGPSHLSALSVTLPPLDLQLGFAHRLDAVETLRKAHLVSLANMNACFASLQSRAFSGGLLSARHSAAMT